MHRLTLARRVTLAALMATLTAGCDDPLLEIQTIVGLRVLGVKVESDENPDRADLEPGESAKLSWLVVSDEHAAVSTYVQYCKARPTTEGLPRCSGGVLGRIGGSGELPLQLTVPLNIPASWSDGDEWVAELAVCGSGDAQFESHTATCSDGSKAIQAFHRGNVGRQPANTNPRLVDDTLTLDGRAWSQLSLLDGQPAPDAGPSTGGDAGAPTSDPPSVNACSDELPRLRIGKKHSISFTLTDGNDDREPLDDDRNETLVFSHLSTLDGLERPFSFIDDTNDGKFELELSFDDELDVPASGRPFDFFLTVRDGRGGADWLYRQACAVTADN